MRYRSFDPSPHRFPKPAVSVLPPLNRHAVALRPQPDLGMLLDAPNAVHYARARYALMDAFQLCGVGTGSALLAPAYHCRTMLDPAIRLGAEILLYPSGPDLVPDMDALQTVVATSEIPIRAMLVSHFFGFSQPMDSLVAWCDENAIAMIEDCSHCLFMPSPTARLGLAGRYCVSSPYKFFAASDGGILWANGGARLPQIGTRSAGLIAECKGAVSAALKLFEGSIAKVDASTSQWRNTGIDESAWQLDDPVNDTDAWSSLYVPSDERRRSLAVSRRIMRHTPIQALTSRRRANYLSWLECVAQLPHCTPLFPDLPPGCVPYMFPLRIDNPNPVFYRLKYLGVPIWRWDDMAVSDCDVATDYRTRVLHLPCHQALTDSQMSWMTDMVSSVIATDTV